MPPEPLKILHLLVTLPVGGAEDLVAGIVTGLDPARFRVQAACIGPLGAVGEELARAGSPVVSLGLDIKRIPAWRIILAVRRLLRETQPDILHTHLYHANLYGRLAALGLGLKGVVASVHNTYSRVKLHRRLANRWLAHHTDRVLVGSPQVREDVSRFDWVPQDKLLLMPYGIPMRNLAVAQSHQEARSRLGVTGFCLGAVGRLEEQKGHRFLLAALPRLRREINDLTVLLVGEGRLRQSLEDQVRDLGVADMVHFLGTRRDLPLIYRALDLYVQPSLWEGLSLAMLQAMGAGLPVVVSRVSGAVDLIADGVSGRLVPPGDAAALTAAILELYHQPETRRHLGDAARQTITEHYSLDAMLHRLGALYEELGSGNLRGGPGERSSPALPSNTPPNPLYEVEEGGLGERAGVCGTGVLACGSPWPPLSSTKHYTILHTESSLGWGGQERRILAEAQIIRSRGHRLLLACDPRGELFDRGREAGFPVFPLAFGGWRNFSAWRELRRLLKGQAVDILNTHSSLDSWVGLLAAKTVRRPVSLVRTRHLSTPVRTSLPTRWLYQSPAAIITTGESTKKLLTERVGVPAARIFSIPTGVALEEFAPREPDQALRARLEIPEGAFIFGCVAVLRSWKGHLFLLEAFKELLDRGAPAFLVLLGDGPYRPVIEAKVRELALPERVRLAGYHHEVAPWLALMDTVVLASYANEGVPQALLQALAMAKPVVGTNIGGIPEIILPGQTGLLVPAKDSRALAQAMHRLMEDRELGRQLGSRGRQLVQQNFSLEHMAAAVEAVYDRLVDEVLSGGPGERSSPALPSSSPPNPL
jgi:glycosyltransferase involved in cell wall biosynthesis